MRCIRLFLFAFLIITSAFQIISAQSWLWARVPLFLGNPYVQSDGEGFSVATDNAGNVYETGYFAFTSMIYGHDTLSSVYDNLYLVKYNASGVPQWARQTTSANGGAFGEFVATDQSGDIYLTGIFSGAVNFGHTTITSDSTAASFLVKYDTNGNLLWARQSTLNAYLGNGSQANGDATDASGDIYITGQFSDSVLFGSVPLKTKGNLNSDVYLVKYDSAGNVIWAREGTIPSSISDAIGNSVAVDPYNNVYVTGTFFDTLSFGSYTLITHSSAGDVFVAKYDPNGNVLWAKQSINYDGSGSIATESGANITNGITTDRSGNVYVAGSYGNAIHFDTLELVNPQTPDGFERDMFVVKYSAEGNILWGLTGSPLDDASYAGVGLASDTFNHIYFNGMAYDYPSGAINCSIKFGSQTFTNTDSPSTEFSLILELDTAGHILCGAAEPMGGDDYEGIAADPSGQYVYMGGDYSVQYTSVIIGPDTINFPLGPLPGGGNYENPFILRWKPCNAALPLSVSISKSDGTCGSSCAGTATANSSGGVYPYTYSWNTHPADTTQIITGLCAGNYAVTVTDSTGATASSNATISNSVIVSSAITAVKDTICTGDTAQLLVMGNTVSIQWQSSTGSNGFASIPGASDSIYFVLVSQTTTFRVITGNGICLDTSQSLVIVVNPLPAPVLNTNDTLICSGDSAQICAFGGYTYNWNTGQASSCIYAFNAGGYWVTATDTAGCSVVSSHQDISVYPVQSVSIVQNGDTLSSFGAISYQWILNGNRITNATGSFYVVTSPGSYAVAVTDSVGCTAISNAVTITGINKLAGEGVSLYPNPSVNSWQLTVDNSLVGSILQVYDDNGRIVFQSTIRNPKSEIILNVGSGIYWLRISNTNVNVVRKLVRL